MIRTSAPFANGSATIPLGTDAALVWHEIALSFQHADGTPFGPVGGGVAAMAVMGVGSDLPESGANTLDLTTQRRWAPFLSSVRTVTITITGAPADALCVATVVSATY